MNSSFRPFRSWECNEGHQVRLRSSSHEGCWLTGLFVLQVHDVQFSVKGDALLAATGSNQAKLFDRDGVETYAPVLRPSASPFLIPSRLSRCVFVKGDPYIRDLRNTEYVRSLPPRGTHLADPPKAGTSQP